MPPSTSIPISVGPCFSHPFGEPEGAEHDPDTATLWTLHLRCGTTLESVRHTADLIFAVGAESLIAYWGGDCFRQWCEPYVQGRFPEQDARALHVEFYAPNADVAVQAGKILSQAAGITSGTQTAVTTTATHDNWFEVWPLTPVERVERKARLARERRSRRKS